MAEIENALAEIRVDEFLALIDLRDGEALSREDVRDEMNHPREFAWVERRKGRIHSRPTVWNCICVLFPPLISSVVAIRPWFCSEIRPKRQRCTRGAARRKAPRRACFPDRV